MIIKIKEVNFKLKNDKKLIDEKWNVIPIEKDKKTPLVKWKEFINKKYPRDLAENYDGNLAVICGAISGNLVIFDLDYKDNNKQYFTQIFSQFYEKYPQLADTYITSTPNGHHIYYYVNGECPKRSPRQDTKKELIIKKLEQSSNPTLTKTTNFPDLLKGVDILGENGYALIPPSVVNNGKYEPMNTKPIRIIALSTFEKIKSFFLQKEPQRQKMREPFFQLLTGKMDIDEQVGITGMKEHVYWKYMYLEAYHKLELMPHEIFHIVKENQPSFDLEKTKTQLQHLDLREHMMKNETMPEYFPEFQQPKRQTYKIKDEQLYITIADYLIDKHHVITMDDSGEILLRHGNVCTNKLSPYLYDMAKEIEAYNKTITHLKRQIEERIKMTTRFSRENFCTEKWLINFKNGYLDLKSKTFYPTEEFQDKLFFYEIPHDYKENSEFSCPKFKKALQQWLGDNNKITIDDVFEMMGYTMTMNTDMKMAFFIFGPSHSGKTQFQIILEHIIGHQNRANISLQRMSKNEFGTHGLQFKILNMVGDMSFLGINDVSDFKTLTGDDTYVRAEPKNLNAYQFENTIKIWYNGNKIPRIELDDDAFYNRWILIEFPHIFPMYDRKTIKGFGQTICDDWVEVEGIINECVAGAYRLMEREYFRKEVVEDSRFIWKYNAEPLYAFLHDSCVQDGESEIDCIDLRTLVNQYYYNRHLRPLTSQKLTQQLESYNIYKVRSSKGDRPYVYCGIRLRRKIDKKVEEFFNKET